MLEGDDTRGGAYALFLRPYPGEFANCFRHIYFCTVRLIYMYKVGLIFVRFVLNLCKFDLFVRLD